MLPQQDLKATCGQERYRRVKIPRRRCYLLPRPPRTGKASAVRAMLSSCGLTFYGLRLHGKNTDDSDLEKALEQAAANSPFKVLC